MTESVFAELDRDQSTGALTEKRIRDAKSGPKPRILWDSKVKGLGVKIQPGGTKSFVLDYRTGGRQRRVSLGRCSEISLSDARARAGRELVAIRDGATDPLRRRQEARDAPTVAEGVARFFDEFVPRRIADGRMTERTAKEYRRKGARIVRAIGRLKVAAVTRSDIEGAVAAAAPVQRNRLLAFCSRLFNVFETWEWRPQHSNPCRGIERAREQPRDRVLSPSEVSALASALGDLEAAHPAPVAAIRVAAVTGLRIGEVLAIRWEHIDFETGRLVMPATKTGRRVHDLPSAALAILAAHPRINEWAFTTGRGAIGYRLAQQTFGKAAQGAGLADVRLHDLRRTVMTNAAAAGVGTHVLRDLLGHKTTAMADRYVRAVGNPVREAREQVGAAMAAMMAGESGEIMDMAARRGR